MTCRGLAKAETTKAPVLTMARGFKRYGPETERTVRKVEVTGDELSYLRQRREMLRSMTGEQAFSVIEFHKGLDAFEALELAKKQGKLIVPNDVIDRILTNTDAQYVVWTGTMTAYEEAGKPFGKTIEYTDAGIRYVFPVPDEFVGVKNGLLVAEHPDFTLETDGNSRIVMAANVELIEKFPTAAHEWYLTDPAHGIPSGAEVNLSNQDARYLFWRIAKRVGLVARGYGNYYDGYNGRRNVYLYSGPSHYLGVALF